MTIDQLCNFLVVCENMSFTKAAQQQYKTQAAVSRQIIALEEALGIQLFERAHSTIQLTPAGLHLARNLRPIISQLEGLLNQVHEMSSGQSGSLVIGLLLDQSMDPKVSRALQKFCQRHNVTISIYRYSVMDLIANLKNGSIDLAVTIESAPNMYAGCESYIYVQEAVCFAAKKTLLAEYGDHVDESVIQHLSKQYPLLIPKLDCFPRATRGQLEKHLHNGNFSPDDVEYDLASIAPMVSVGLAITMVNESHILAVDQSIALFDYDPSRTMSKGVFWMADTSNPLVELFVDFFKESERNTVVTEL